MRKAIYCNALLVILEAAGMILSFMRKQDDWLCYYTHDSNAVAMAAGIIFLIYACRGKMPGWARWLRYISGGMLMVTFGVVIFVLCPMMSMQMGLVKAYGYMLFDGSMLFQHLLCPVLSTMSFICFEKYEFTAEDNVLMTLPTLGYGLIMVALNAAGIVDGPYPFFEIGKVSISVCIACMAGIMLLAYSSGFILRISKKNKV